MWRDVDLLLVLAFGSEDVKINKWRRKYVFTVDDVSPIVFVWRWGNCFVHSAVVGIGEN